MKVAVFDALSKSLQIRETGESGNNLSLEMLYSIIGCECIATLPNSYLPYLEGYGVVAFIDDEGKIAGKMPSMLIMNEYEDGPIYKGRRLNKEVHDVVVGHILFTGVDPDSGECVSLNQEQIDRIIELTALYRVPPMFLKSSNGDKVFLENALYQTIKREGCLE